METSGTEPINPLPTCPSVATILGVKGPLRFSPHGSTQKPHIILRRVTVPEDSNGDGQVNHVVRFSFFAQKRIEVRPGKEILLTVAGDDGQFENQCVVFEGDSLGSPAVLGDSKDTQVATKEQSSVPIMGGAIPPKMRRAWTKRNSDGNHTLQPPSVTRSSIGIQAAPPQVSVSTQTESLLKSMSSQTHSLSVSASVQVDPLPAPNLFPAANAPPSCKCATLGVRTHSPGIISPKPHQYPDGITKGTQKDNNREPSGSPMEIDSRSPTPEHSPTMLEYRSVSPQDTLTPSSTASTSGGQGTRICPIELKPLHNSKKFSTSMTTDISLTDIDKHIRSSGLGLVSSHNLADMSMKHKPGPTPRISHTTSIRPDAGLPKGLGQRVITNPFVSAGFVTEFVGFPVKSPVRSGDITSRAPVKVEEVEDVFSGSKPGAGPEQKGATPLLTEGVKAGPTPIGRSAPPNAIASSSRLALDKKATKTSIPSGPKSLVNLSSRAREKSPVTSAPLQGGAQALAASPETTDPPPDPRSLAHISTGPSSNPLNIRPSATLRKAVGALPAQPVIKKRFVVGASWPLVKALHAPPATPPPPSAPPPPQPSPAAPTSTRPSNLSTILTYSSPSPPLPSPDISIAANGRWKPLVSQDSVIPISPTKPQKAQQESSSVGKFQPIQPAVNGSPQTLTLKDRIAPPSSLLPQTETPVLKDPVNACDLLSRISAAHAPHATQSKEASDGAIKSSSPDAPTSGRGTSVSSAGTIPVSADPRSLPPPLAPSTSFPATKPATPSVVIQPLTHPLPPKPVLALGVNGSSRGCKRGRPISPDSPVRRPRRTFRWPTIDSNYNVGLKGEGQLGIRAISFNSDGSYFALSCADRTLRIWNNRNRTEVARLTHTAHIAAVSWIDDDSGVISLGEDGLVSKWTRSGQNAWVWAKVLDAGNERRSEDDPICMAYARDRIAVSFPRVGVKVWVWSKGTWLAQRSILRQNVSAIKFVEDGDALVGGTRDGALWYCEIPNGTLRAYAFLQSKINSLDLDPTGSHVLVGQHGGCAKLVGIRQLDKKGQVERTYSCTETEARPNGGFGAFFATEGQAILFGSVDGCVLVWDRKKGAVVYGLEHEEGDLIQAVASFDGSSSREGCLVTGTKSGYLAWWSQPQAASKSESKRAKSS